MDQPACAASGSVAVDFKEAAHPAVRRIPCDPAAAGYALCIVNTGASHAELTAEYAAIPGEMKQAAFLEKEVLRDVEETDFWHCLPALREAVGGRAVLRAVHFFTDNALAGEEVRALEQGNFSSFWNLSTAPENLPRAICKTSPVQPAPQSSRFRLPLRGRAGCWAAAVPCGYTAADLPDNSSICPTRTKGGFPARDGRGLRPGMLSFWADSSHGWNGILIALCIIFYLYFRM